MGVGRAPPGSVAQGERRGARSLQSAAPPHELPLPDEGRTVRGHDAEVRVQAPPARPISLSRAIAGMNRLKELFDRSPEPEREDDFFEIETYQDLFAVSRDVAVDVERRLDQLPPPHWIVFRDLTGARHRVLATQIHRVSECTASQRAARRAFYRARRLEDKADRRPWEDDD